VEAIAFERTNKPKTGSRLTPGIDAFDDALPQGLPPGPFASAEGAELSCKQWANGQGSGVIISKRDRGNQSRGGQLTLVCMRAGVPNSAGGGARSSGSQKCNCHFTVIYEESDTGWVPLKCRGTHNHDVNVRVITCPHHNNY